MINIKKITLQKGNNENLGCVFYIYPSYKTTYDAVISGSEDNLHEIMMPNEPVKFFLDIDYKKISHKSNRDEIRCKCIV